MFYMPGTRMLFGDARVTTEGKQILSESQCLVVKLTCYTTAIKAAIEARFK
jgi:hypothetical protein